MGALGCCKRPGRNVSSVQGLEAIEGAARAAALDASAWPELLSRICAIFDCKVAVLGFVDLSHQALVHVESHGLRLPNLPAWAEYRSRTWRHDRHARILSGIETASIYSDADYALADVDESDEYIRWLNQLGVLHHLSFAVRDGDLVASLGVHRSRADGPFSADERQKMASVAATVEHSLRVAVKQSVLALQTFWTGLTMSTARQLCLLDGCGRVLRATPAFFEAEGGTIFIRSADQQLSARHRESDVRLKKALADAARAGRERSYRLALASEGKARLLASVRPVSAPPSVRLYNQARVLVELYTTTETLDGSADLLRDVYGATAAEARVAIALARGDTLAEMADELGVSRETVRVHLKRLFQKTETNRQALLVRLVSMLSMGS